MSTQLLETSETADAVDDRIAASPPDAEAVDAVDDRIAVTPPDGEAVDRIATSPTADHDRLIDRFMPDAMVRESRIVVVRAPAEHVLEIAERFDLLSIPVIRAIFSLRSRLLGASPPQRDELNGLVAATGRMGWVELARRPGRQLVMGAATRPWVPAPVFEPVAPDRFVEYAEPDHVKIVWTLEVEPLGPSSCTLRTETRVQPTDAAARRRFRWYWMRAGIGILLIRWFALPAMRRQAEHGAGTSRA